MQGILLKNYEEQFANLPDHLQLIKQCSSAGITKTVPEGTVIQNKTREEDGIQNRHNPSVLREEDGAVEFRILAQIFRSEFTSSQQWSIRALLNYLQKGGGLKRDSSIVWIHTLLLPSYTFEQFKATLEENTSILHGKMTCCYRATSLSTSITLEAPTRYTRSLNLDYFQVAKTSRKEETVFFTAVNLVSIHLHKQRDYDVTKPTIAVHKHNWKKCNGVI